MITLLRILEAYRTGRGRIVVRGKADIELLDSKTKRSAVIIKEVIILIASVVDSNFPHIVHEWFDSTPCLRLGMKQIPYQTNKSSLVEKIAELVENKVLPSYLRMLLFLEVCGKLIACVFAPVFP